MSLEQELTKAAKYKPVSQHDRQDHLAALARAANKLTDDQFDKLSDKAANWVSAAIKALNAKDEIEDFEDAEPADENPGEEGNEASAEDSSEEASDGTKPGSGEDYPEFDAKAESDNEAKEAAEDARSAKSTKPKVRAEAKKPPKKATETAEEAPKKKERITTTRYDNLDGSKDRYGLVKGTKTWEAVQMYEKGCTTAQIKKTLGGRYYNILKVLEERGHRVERFPGGKFLVTHRDDLEAKKKAKK